MTRLLGLKKLERHTAWMAQGKRCAYCHCELKLEDVTADHVTPRSRGGTEDGNIVCACLGCNQAKGSMSKTKFARLLRTGVRPRFDIRVCQLRRRVNLAADRACRRIRASVGLP